MKYALIVNEIVHELFDTRPVFHSSLEIDEVDDNVEVYFIRKGDSYVKPPVVEMPTYQPPVSAEIQSLLDRIAALEAKAGGT